MIIHIRHAHLARLCQPSRETGQKSPEVLFSSAVFHRMLVNSDKEAKNSPSRFLKPPWRQNGSRRGSVDGWCEYMKSCRFSWVTDNHNEGFLGVGDEWYEGATFQGRLAGEEAKIFCRCFSCYFQGIRLQRLKMRNFRWISVTVLKWLGTLMILSSNCGI